MGLLYELVHDVTRLTLYHLQTLVQPQHLAHRHKRLQIKLIPTDPQLLHGPILLQTFEQMSQVLFRNLTRLQPQPLQGPIFGQKVLQMVKLFTTGQAVVGQLQRSQRLVG